MNIILSRLLKSRRSLLKDLYGKSSLLQTIPYKNNVLKLKQNVQYYCSKPKKPETCNVGTIGHVDHGKTTLTAAITKYLSEKDKNCKYVSYDEIDKAPEEKKRGITINIAHIGYATKKRQYAHTDCPGHADFIKNMISGASQMDGAILVVAANDGPMPQTKEHLLLIKQIGIKHVIIYVNKVDLVDQEITELVELETRELLENLGFDSDNTPFIYGSALLALNGDTSKFGQPSVQSLLDALDNYFPVAERDYTSPFVIPIDNVFTSTGRGTVVVGTLAQGIVKRGMQAELIGFNETIKTVVTDIQIFRKSVTEACAGENVGLLLRGVKLDSVRRGMLLCETNALNLTNQFEAQVYLLNPEEGGRHKPLPLNGYTTQIYCSTWNIHSRFDFTLQPGVNMLMPGEFATAKLTLVFSMPIVAGKTFTLREKQKTIGTGQITKVLPPIKVPDNKLNLVTM